LLDDAKLKGIPVCICTGSPRLVRDVELDMKIIEKGDSSCDEIIEWLNGLEGK